MAKRDVVQCVSEARRAWGLWAADGPFPADNGRDMYIDNGAAVAVFSYCPSCGEGGGRGEQRGRFTGVKERQAQWVARGQAQDTPSANERREAKERREDQRSASVYVFVCRRHGGLEW
jgi:hypothetical protein